MSNTDPGAAAAASATDPAAEADRQQAGRNRSAETRERFANEVVSYGDADRQKFEIFYPNGEPKGPSLVFLHGGGFRVGDPLSVAYHGRYYLEAGAIYASLGYRLLPDDDDLRIEDICDDVEAGLRALAAKVAEHGGDPEQIYLSGHSAGAIAAAYVALRPSDAISPDLIKGVVLISGMYDFDRRGPERYDQGSPRHVPNLFEHIAHVPGHTILVGGDADFPDVLPDAERLAGVLRERGGSVESFVEPGADHFQANNSFVAASGPVHDATITMMKLG